jgi:hypothetical protein
MGRSGLRPYMFYGGRGFSSRSLKSKISFVWRAVPIKTFFNISFTIALSHRHPQPPHSNPQLCYHTSQLTERLPMPTALRRCTVHFGQAGGRNVLPA